MAQSRIADAWDSFRDNIDHVVDHKVRMIEVDDHEEAKRVHMRLMVRAFGKLNIKASTYDPNSPQSIDWFFRKVETQLKAKDVVIEHRNYDHEGSKYGGAPDETRRSGWYFFKNPVLTKIPELVYFISDPAYYPRPGILHNPIGGRFSLDRWVVMTNVPND